MRENYTTLYKNLKAQLYLLLHTPLWLIHLLVPILGSTLFVWYYSFSAWDELNKLSGFIEGMAVVFPVLIGIVTAVMVEMEQRAGNFQMILIMPGARVRPHVSRLFWLIVFGFVSTLIALVSFGAGFRRLGYTSAGMGFYVETAVLMMISALPIYFLQYVVGLFLGKGYSIGLGIVGGLLSALLLTGLGDGIWWFLPWGIMARFAEDLLVSKNVNVDFLQYQCIIQSIIFIVLLSAVFFLMLLIGTRKWEGRRSED